MFKSNHNGEFVITKEKIGMEIKESTQFFPMDYDSRAENFKGSVKVIIESVDDINKRMNNIKEFFPEIMDEMKSIVEGNTNKMIAASFSKIVQIKESIKLDLSSEIISK